MPISTQIISNYTKLRNYTGSINKTHKLDALQSFCESFGLELQRSSFFSDKIVKKQDNTWDKLTYQQKEALLQYLDKLHESINGNNQQKLIINNIKDIEEIAKKNIIDLPEIKDPQQLLFLIAHRDGKTHTRYATRIKIFRDFLSNDLKICRQILENHLDTWVKLNNNQDGYKEAKNRILECLKPEITALDLSKLNLHSIPPEDIFKYLTHIKNLNLSGNQIIEIKGDEFDNLKKLEELNLGLN